MRIKLHLNENIEWACNLHWIEFKFISTIGIRFHLKRYGMQIGGEGIEKLLFS
jgi:hypothetical protein